MDLSKFLKQKRQTLFSIFIIFLIIGSVFVLVQDFKFGTKSKILVIQEGYGRVDPYAVSRSVEYLSDLFSRVIYSNSFFALVLNSDFDIDKSYFGEDASRQMKKWKKTISAKAVENSGIINISIYHPDANQAKQIALAVNHILITKNQNYQGLGDSVKVSVLDQPVVSKYPVKPNLVFNLFFILGFSLLFGLVYIYVFPEEKYDLNFFSKNKNRKKIKDGRDVLRENIPNVNQVNNNKFADDRMTDRRISDNRMSESGRMENNNNDYSGSIDNIF